MSKQNALGIISEIVKMVGKTLWSPAIGGVSVEKDGQWSSSM
jgi:Na+-transporting NADH:ubiquinone oxidoreductase subunit NqrC